jgi:Immunoglobulin domain
MLWLTCVHRSSGWLRWLRWIRGMGVFLALGTACLLPLMGSPREQPTIASGSCDQDGFLTLKPFGLGLVGDPFRWPAIRQQRNWIAFQVPAYAASVTGAVINLQQGTSITNFPFAYPIHLETFVLSHVATAYERLLQVDSESKDVYTDLGEGDRYGSVVLEPIDTGGYRETQVRLSARFIQEIQSRPNQTIVLGGHLSSLDDLPGNGEAFFDPEQEGFGRSQAKLSFELDSGGAPVILSSLRQAFDLSGGSDRISVEVLSDEPVTYQWFHNGVPMDVAAPEISVPRVKGTGGTYHVVVSNRFGSRKSMSVDLAEAGLQWVRQPENQEAAEGSPAALSALVSLRIPCLPGQCDRTFHSVWTQNGRVLDFPQNTSGAGLVGFYLGLRSDRPVVSDYQLMISSPGQDSITSAVVQVKTVRVAPSILPLRNSHIQVRLGEAVTLSPEVKPGGPPASFTWFFNDVVVQNAGTSARLDLPSVQPTQVGRYQLVASNPIGSATSEVITVSINSIPPPLRFSYLSPSLTMLLENPTSIWMRIESSFSGPLEIKCFRGVFPLGTEVPTGDNFFLRTARELPIQGLLSDQGEYWWIVKSDSQSITSPPIRIQVIAEEPRFVVEPTDGTVDAGGYAFFHAEAVGGPPPTLRWFFDNKPASEATGPILYLSPVTPSQGGNYFVVASNFVGMVTSRVARLSVRTQVPSFTAQPSDVHTNAGDWVRLQAFAVGVPPPTYQWYFEGTPLPNATDLVLLFQTQSRANVGKYWSVARNIVGSATSAVAQVALDFAPPEFTFRPTDVKAPLGRSITLFAEAKGAPPPQFSWEREGGAIVDSLDGLLTLEGKDRTDAGRYRAIARNSEGMSSSDWVTVSQLDPERAAFWKKVDFTGLKAFSSLLVEEGQAWVGFAKGVFAISPSGTRIPDSSHDAGSGVTGMIHSDQ